MTVPMNLKMASVAATSVIALTTGAAKPEISRDALPEGRVITPNNRCGQGFSWCEKQGKCVKPLALLKGRDIHDLKKIFEQECGSPR